MTIPEALSASVGLLCVSHQSRLAWPMGWKEGSGGGGPARPGSRLKGSFSGIVNVSLPGVIQKRFCSGAVRHKGIAFGGGERDSPCRQPVLGGSSSQCAALPTHRAGDSC